MEILHSENTLHRVLRERSSITVLFTENLTFQEKMNVIYVIWVNSGNLK